MHHFAKQARPNKATLLKMQVKLFYDIGCEWMGIEWGPMESILRIHSIFIPLKINTVENIYIFEVEEENITFNIFFFFDKLNPMRPSLFPTFPACF